YSLGVGQDVSWDLEMANKGCQIFLYDHTVESLPAEHPNFHWSKIGIEGKSSPDATFRTIDELIAQNGHKGRKDLILKTDIEAAEWPVFAEMSEETLCQFSQIIGEFHRLARVVDPQYREMMLTALRKINKHFQLVHAHANNFTGMALVAGVPVYYCMEMAFVRRSDHEFTATKRSFPTPLDYPCISRLPDLFLDGFGT
ncbi:MAG: FkbM family methyltransferase, partial [Bdellovibrionales bacterium]